MVLNVVSQIQSPLLDLLLRHMKERVVMFSFNPDAGKDCFMLFSYFDILSLLQAVVSFFLAF